MGVQWKRPPRSGTLDRRHCRRGIDGLVEALSVLAGASVPASVLETDVLPARMAEYRSADLDALGLRVARLDVAERDDPELHDVTLLRPGRGGGGSLRPSVQDFWERAAALRAATEGRAATDSTTLLRADRDRSPMPAR